MNEKWFDIIEDYLNGDLNREERMRFEAELKANEELCSVFEVYRTIEEDMRNDAGHRSGELLFRNSLEMLNKKYGGSQQSLPGAEPDAHFTASIPVAGAVEDSEILVIGQDQTGAIQMKTWKKLAVAAVVIGVVLLGTTLFLEQKKEVPEMARVNVLRTDTQKKSLPTDTSSKVHTFRGVVRESNKNRTAPPPGRRIKPVPIRNQNVYKEQLDALFARYAKPDSLPAQG